jgi:hypothetical protein
VVGSHALVTFLVTVHRFACPWLSFVQKAGWRIPIIRNSEEEMFRRNLDGFFRNNILHIGHFRKVFDMVPRKNLWNRLEEIKVPLKLRVSAIRMYENAIAKFKNTKGWLKEINYNIGVKQGCPLSPSLFGIYIDKLEDCLEKKGCVIPTLTRIVINILLYVDDIVLMVRSPHDLENQLRILKDVSPIWVCLLILIRLRS